MGPIYPPRGRDPPPGDLVEAVELGEELVRGRAWSLAFNEVGLDVTK